MRLFEVTYSVTRTETYRMKAASPEIAEEEAFMAGENIALGAADRVHISTEAVRPHPRRKRGRSTPKLV